MMEHALRAALLGWLRDGPAPLDMLNTLEEEAPARAAPPWIAIAASASTDWSTKDRTGREIRIALELHTRGDDPAGDAALVRAVEARVEAMPHAWPAVPAPFAIAHILFLRGRTERRARALRSTLIEYRFRCLAAG